MLIERRKELFGEGFSLSDIIRTQGKVVRNPYTTADGKPIKVKVTTPDGTVKEVDARGHSVFTFLIKVNLCLIVAIIYSQYHKKKRKAILIFNYYLTFTFKSDSGNDNSRNFL